MDKTMIRGIMFLIAMLLIPAASAGIDDMKRAYPENDTVGYVPVDIIVIDPVIKAASPDHIFLVLDADGKKNYLDASSLNKDEMIKIAGALTPISDELNRQIPGPQERGT
jgi:hypothetical protein